MKELITWSNEVLKSYPDLKNDILDLISLCENEIEEGGSPTHEIELCKESIKQLIQE